MSSILRRLSKATEASSREARIRERARLDELVRVNTPRMEALLRDVEHAQGKPRTELLVTLVENRGRMDLQVFPRSEYLAALRKRERDSVYFPALIEALELAPEPPTFHVVARAGLSARVYRINTEVML